MKVRLYGEIEIKTQKQKLFHAHYRQHALTR